MNTINETKDLVEVSYDDKVVKAFTLATLLWGAVAMLLGTTIAFQLADFNFNFNPWDFYHCLSSQPYFYNKSG